MKSYIEAMKELRAVLTHASPLQLTIASEVIAFMYVESYIEHNPLPEASEAERKELHAAMIYSTITRALNTAAKVALDLSAKPQQPSAEDEARAKAAAESTIAKAQGRLQ